VRVCTWIEILDMSYLVIYRITITTLYEKKMTTFIQTTKLEVPPSCKHKAPYPFEDY
jgi:hypothetical protein